MTKTEYYLDFLAIPILVLLLIHLSPTSWFAFLAGLFFWTIAEYVIHRYLFHRVPFFKGPHDTHHERPSGMTGVTSFQSLSIFASLAVAVMLGLIPGYLLAGFTTGYFAYISIHHMYHHWRITPDSPVMYAGKMRHKMHHLGVEANFGVTTTLWDRVFGTYQKWHGLRS